MVAGYTKSCGCRHQAFLAAYRTQLRLVGKTFGLLTVTSRADRRTAAGNALWHCVCACGTSCIAIGTELVSGKRRSCGCSRREVLASVAAQSQRYSMAAGLAATEEYRAWVYVRGACKHPNNGLWKCYGARGIKICERWADNFLQFLADMGPRPIGARLARKDSNGDFAPDNCYWATHSLKSRYYSHAGITDNISGWAKRLGMTRNHLWRITSKQGKTIAEVADARGFKS